MTSTYEGAVKFSCPVCKQIVIAPQGIQLFVCANCGRLHKTTIGTRFEHFSIIVNQRQILYASSEWVDVSLAIPKLQWEFQKLDDLERSLSSERPTANSTKKLQAVETQKHAVDYAISICRRLEAE